MSHYFPAAGYTLGRDSLFRLMLFCLLSVLIHAVVITWIKLPSNHTDYKTIRPLFFKVHQPVSNPREQKALSKPPAKTITPKQKAAPMVTKNSQVTAKSGQEFSPAVVKPLTKIPEPTHTARKKLSKLEQSAQPPDPVIFSSDTIKYLSDMPLDMQTPEDSFQVFHPDLQRRIHQAREDKLKWRQPQPESLQLNIDEKSTDIDGYRETVINGQCWLIPSDSSFEQLDSRVAMISSNCGKPGNQLSELIKSLKPEK